MDVTPPALSSVVEDLWRLEPSGPDRFVGWGRAGAPTRVFGGQMVAQALAAAGADLPPDWAPHSLHGYFVREGRTGEPIEYRVEPVDDADDVRFRYVTANQSDEPIVTLQASFRPVDDAGRAALLTRPERSDPALDPPAWTSGDPADTDWFAQQFRRMPFDLRFVTPPTQLLGRRGDVADGQRLWLRAREPLPDRALDHACAVAYFSDLFLVSTVLARHGRSGRQPGTQAASLDHAVWFHRLARADDWLLYEQSTPTAASGRGLAAGRILDRAGNLVATVRQEVLFRVVA